MRLMVALWKRCVHPAAGVHLGLVGLSEAPGCPEPGGGSPSALSWWCLVGTRVLGEACVVPTAGPALPAQWSRRIQS